MTRLTTELLSQRILLPEEMPSYTPTEVTDPVMVKVVSDREVDVNGELVFFGNDPLFIFNSLLLQRKSEAGSTPQQLQNPTRDAQFYPDAESQRKRGSAFVQAIRSIRKMDDAADQEMIIKAGEGPKTTYRFSPDMLFTNAAIRGELLSRSSYQPAERSKKGIDYTKPEQAIEIADTKIDIAMRLLRAAGGTHYELTGLSNSRDERDFSKYSNEELRAVIAFADKEIPLLRKRVAKRRELRRSLR